MRKAFFGILLALIGAGAFAVWWVFFWVNPQEVMASAFDRLARAATVSDARASVYWDLRHPSGQGFVPQKRLSYAGSLDLSDPTEPTGQGVIGYSEDPGGSVIQTADVNIFPDRLFVRLRDDASEDTRNWFEESRRSVESADRRTGAASVSTLSATGTDSAWFSFDRSTVLKKGGVGSWEAKGTGANVRAAIMDASIGSWVAVGSSRLSIVDGRRVMDANIRLKFGEIESGLIALIQAWRKRDPTGMEFDWANRSAAGVSHSSARWTATVDVASRTVRALRGTFPLVSENGEIIGHATIIVGLAGFGAPVSVARPEGSVDLTSAIEEKRPTTFPASGLQSPDSAR